MGFFMNKRKLESDVQEIESRVEDKGSRTKRSPIDRICREIKPKLSSRVAV